MVSSVSYYIDGELSICYYMEGSFSPRPVFPSTANLKMGHSGCIPSHRLQSRGWPSPRVAPTEL